MHTIYADIVASITELKKNPMEVVNHGEGNPIAILNRNDRRSGISSHCYKIKIMRPSSRLVYKVEVIAVKRENQ